MDPAGRLAVLGNQRGLALVYIALIIFALMGFLGLAVDVGHLQLVRGELQNSADAVARAGAYSLYRNPPNLPALDWDRARMAAKAFVDKTKSDGASLADGTIEVGYWSLSKNILQSTTITPASDDVPAVRATISRSAGSNGGPVSTFFMKVLGLNDAPVSSLPAVAVSGFPGGVSPNTLFPMALSSCMANDIFSRPPEQWPNPINISSPYGAGGPGCYSGQWTSFKLDSNSVSTIRDDLMAHGNPDPLQIGDSIWIQPGEEGALYQTNQWPFELPPEGLDVLMAIVDTEETDLKTKGERTITGFAAFHIDGTTSTGSDKYVYGHFTAYYDENPPGIRPGGPPSNVVIPSVTVQ